MIKIGKGKKKLMINLSFFFNMQMEHQEILSILVAKNSSHLKYKLRFMFITTLTYKLKFYS